ncbi:competence-induced protein Ccs50 [Streptococcus pneumoniae]|nr:competence-induced protein Ccs50 [Streptococcus pneumoniae]
MESLLILLLIANLAGLFLIWQRQDRQEKHLSKSLEDQADHLSDQLDYRFAQSQKSQPVRPKRFGSGCQRPFARSAD